MFNINIINGYSDISLDIIASFAIIAGIAVIITKNPIVSVLFLIFLFLSVSAYLMMLGLNYIGLSYLLVYIGAISILFIFILMLINIRISEIVTLTGNSIPLAIIIGIAFIYTVYPALPDKFSSNMIFDNLINYSFFYNINNYNNLNICNLNSSVWDTMIAHSLYINSLGNILYTTYPLWIILTSLVLLLAMVGCILISLK